MAHFTLRSAPARSFFAVAASIAMAAPVAHAQSNEAQTASDGSFFDGNIRGRNVLSVGVLHIHPTDSSTPLSTSSSALGLGTYESPGTSAKTGSSTTLSVTQTYFVNGNWAATTVGGIPPTTNIYGRGKVVAPVPGLGNLTLIDLGLPKKTPLHLPVRGTRRSLGSTTSALRRAGCARSLVRASATTSSPNCASIRTSLPPWRTWTKSFSWAWARFRRAPPRYRQRHRVRGRPWPMSGCPTSSLRTGACRHRRLPATKTTSTITLRSQEGQVLTVNKKEINVKPVVFSVNVGYRF